MSFEGPFLQSLYLKLGHQCTNGDVAIWVGTAMKRGLVELKLEYDRSCVRRFLPKSLYTCCETLVVLKLEEVGLDVPDIVSLKSLKTLSLIYVRYSEGISLLKLLPNCPVLEDLLIKHVQYNYMPPLIIKIDVPSLKRLSLLNLYEDIGITELEIDAPSLKHLHIEDRLGWINKVVKANIDVTLSRPVKIMHSFASIEHIRLCLSASEVLYPVGSCFHRLKHLEVCTCQSKWLSLFMRLLEDSPSLKVIKINQSHFMPSRSHSWNPPGSVPRCLSSNLETLEWINYEGTQGEKELATYILKNAACLKKASFFARSSDPKKKLQMLRELALSRRVSTTCELVFN